MSEKYELHIVTFGSRQYAHKIAEILEDQTRRQLNLDSNKSFFSHRILSRDECVDPFHKSGNLEHLFPCGDSMCAIIDDRGDVWRYSPNCILVKKEWLTSWNVTAASKVTSLLFTSIFSRKRDFFVFLMDILKIARWTI
jgi:TFIIF-interacting CTD phosphatase-like protein